MLLTIKDRENIVPCSTESQKAYETKIRRKLFKNQVCKHNWKQTPHVYTLFTVTVPPPSGGKMIKDILEKQSEKAKKYEEYYDSIWQGNEELLKYWYQHSFLHWDFWLSLLLALCSWIIFIKFRKKDSTARLLFVAMFIIIICSGLDFLGVIHGLWYYTGDIYPSIPAFLTWDCSVLPVLIVLIIQYKPNIHPLRKALFFGVFGCLGEFLFTAIHLYEDHHWRVYYSFPIYIILYLAAHWLSQRTSFAPISYKNEK